MPDKLLIDYIHPLFTSTFHLYVLFKSHSPYLYLRYGHKEK